MVDRIVLLRTCLVVTDSVILFSMPVCYYVLCTRTLFLRLQYREKPTKLTGRGGWALLSSFWPLHACMYMYR